MKRAEILNLSLFSKWQRMNRFVCVFFLGKGERACGSPMAAAAQGEGDRFKSLSRI